MKPAKTKETRCATCGKPLGDGDGFRYCFACEPHKPEAASETRQERQGEIVKKTKKRRPTFRACEVCGRPTRNLHFCAVCLAY
jgi:ribosomal protein L34E